MTKIIEDLGSDDTTDCIRRVAEAEPAEQDANSDAPPEVELVVSNELDVGIGDHRAALDFRVSVMSMIPITIDFEYVVARPATISSSCSTSQPERWHLVRLTHRDAVSR